MSKGSKPRPCNKSAFDENFDKIFGKGKKDDKPKRRSNTVKRDNADS